MGKKHFLLIALAALVVVIFLGCSSKEDVVKASSIDKISVDYYSDINNYTNQQAGESVEITSSLLLGELAELINYAYVHSKSTSKPVGFPRFAIIIYYVNGDEETLTVDCENCIASELFGGGNYVSTEEENYYMQIMDIVRSAVH